MNVENVVSVFAGSDSDSDWNGSEEEMEDYLEDNSLRVDRLSMELGKMVDTRVRARGSVALLDFVIRR